MLWRSSLRTGVSLPPQYAFPHSKKYIKNMDSYILTGTNFDNMTQSGTNDSMFNIAVNEFTVALTNDNSKQDHLQFTVYVDQAANGQFGTSGTTTSGDYTWQGASNSIPVTSVAPSYFPVATAGSECAAVVKSLSWADSNLLTGYDYILYNPKSAAADKRYFVTGILNSSQTQANDPFSSTTYPDVVKACCWAGNFVSGINPFD